MFVFLRVGCIELLHCFLSVCSSSLVTFISYLQRGFVCRLNLIIVFVCVSSWVCWLFFCWHVHYTHCDFSESESPISMKFGRDI